MEPTILTGGCFTDNRGTLLYNNIFDASAVKRIYVIENKDTSFIRGWQGHRIEQRWFSAISGSFKIQLIAIDNWDNPSNELSPVTFYLQAKNMDILHIPQGYVTSIQALEEGSKLMVMADYKMGEIKDEFRLDIDYFKNNG
ncbi:MAG TPA: WxcM-like domain-containing protein [Ferruginibacter sp.]|nr:WxcM-like domain-containing protein [Ferruginibacter sp.]